VSFKVDVERLLARFSCEKIKRFMKNFAIVVSSFVVECKVKIKFKDLRFASFQKVLKDEDKVIRIQKVLKDESF